MKQLQLFLISFLVMISLNAQSSQKDSTLAKSNLKSAAQKMGSYFTAKNYSEYVKFIHPEVLKMVGGQDKMVDVVKGFVTQLEGQGFTFNKITFSDPSAIIYTSTDVESVVPQILDLQTKKGRYLSTSYLIALSNDKGKTWYFADTAGKTLKEMKTVFPTLSDKLVIPKKTPPVLYKN